MDKISSNIEALGFDKWFQDNVDPEKLKGLEIARVIAVHKDSYVIHNGEKDVIAELIGKMLFSASSPIDLPAVGDWVLASFHDEDSFGDVFGSVPTVLDDDVVFFVAPVLPATVRAFVLLLIKILLQYILVVFFYRFEFSKCMRLL